MNNTYTTFAVFSSHLAVGREIYMVGIGGVSMMGLALFARKKGYFVRGCDRNMTSENVKRLISDGISVENEADADPKNATLLVYSLAVGETSPTIVAARTYGIPMVSRADFLGYMIHDFPIRIAVAGMHGKSTTVGMIASVLSYAGLHPTVLSGAPLVAGGLPYRLDGDHICIAEACEYRNSFLALRPTLGVVTNIELDHPDFFPDMAAVEDSFSRFLWRCDSAIVGGDCPALDSIADPTVQRFGFDKKCTIRGEITQNGMTVYDKGEPIGHICLGVTGVYNYENALAAVATALHLSIPFPVIAEALAAFRGIGRRMEYVGELSAKDGGKASVYLDYAHHPTEITAAITAARENGRRILVAFQPHTYSRTRALWDAFTASLRLADYAVLTDIYAAREAEIYGTSSSILAREACADYAPDLPCAAQLLRATAQNGDALLILGAGDIDRLIPHLFDNT